MPETIFQIDEQVQEIVNTNTWKPISTAPKTGIVIEINYGTPETPKDVCLAVWSQRPVCMGGPTVFRNPGWATVGDETDKNLPLDEPNFWREAL